MDGLLYHSGALGDFITIIPSISLWRKFNQNKKLVLLGKLSHGTLLQAAGLVDDYLDIDSSLCASLFSDDLSTYADLFLNQFDIFIIFASENSPLLRHVSKLNSKGIYHQKPFPDSPINIIDYHLMLFLKYDSSYRIEIPFLKISNHKNDQTNENQKNTIAIAPGSGSPRKNWPFKNYLQTAELLKLKGFKIIWIIGPADQQLKLPKVDIVFNNEELLLVTKLLSNCTGFIGNDSGITHLSAAVGCPTTALFGASDPTVWGPRGKNVNILFKKQNCSPCHPSRKNNNQCNSLCLKSITVNEVINSTLNIIKKSQKLLLWHHE